MVAHRPRSTSRPAEAVDHLRLGRGAYRRRAWEDAYGHFMYADEAFRLGAADLEQLAMAAYLTGRDEAYLRALDRAHRMHLRVCDCSGAARCAFWLGLRLAFLGKTGAATGWFRRAQRLLQRAGRPCVEEGYLLLPVAEQELRSGSAEHAYATAARATAFGDRFADADLVACARHVQGRALLLLGQVEEGLALLDEAMIAATAGELSPIMTGLVYCSVVEACQQFCAVDRAREWTSALAAWCAGQPQMVTFTRTCLVHRAEIMQLNGAWQDAIEEARRACAGCEEGAKHEAPPAAYYQQAEIHRLRGEFGAAEEAYREASRRGYEPLPGLALLRLAQGRTDVAVAAIGRALSTTGDPLQRAKLLPAYLEIMLSVRDLESARHACCELAEYARRFRTTMLQAMAANALGAFELARGNARAALSPLRHAFKLWLQVVAPHFAACARVLVGLACRAVGDEESANLELSAAREAFVDLGAVPDIARLDSVLSAVPSPCGQGLTRRELQVLRLVASGKANRMIAAELHLSEKTVDRHVSNILSKLEVPSRTAAAAWAYENRLM